jgi:hypothetical protein
VAPATERRAFLFNYRCQEGANLTTYLRYIAEPIVQVGGTVVTPEMISDGWFPYEGVVPVGDPLALINGVLVPFEQTKGVGGWMN